MMNPKELEKQVKELKELKLMQEEVQAEISAIEDSLKAEMVAQNTDELHAGIFKIRWSTVRSNRFDSMAFKKVYAELYKQFTRVIESKRFCIV